MSVWSTTHELKSKRYLGSHIDPRKKAPITTDELDLAVVADYVYNDRGYGYEILPYLRLGVGAESVVLTEGQTKELIEALVDFLKMRKWRGRGNVVRSASE